MPTLAENLRRIRREKRLSQGKLAEQSGVSQQLISQIENGVNTTTKELPKLAKALGVPVSDLDEQFHLQAPAEKIPQQVLEAFEQIPGAPLTEDEIQLLLGQLRLIAKSRKPHNGDSPDNGQQPAN